MSNSVPPALKNLFNGLLNGNIVLNKKPEVIKMSDNSIEEGIRNMAPMLHELNAQRKLINLFRTY